MSSKNKKMRVLRRDKHFHPTAEEIEKHNRERSELTELDKIMPIRVFRKIEREHEKRVDG